MNKYISAVAFTAILTINAVRLNANDFRGACARDTIEPLIELMKVQAYYQSDGDELAYVGAGLQYKYIEYDADTIVTQDSTDYALQTWGGKYMFSNYTYLLNIQDEYYHILVNHQDSTITVQPPIELYKMLFNVDILDTVLQSQIHSIYSFDSAGIRYHQFMFINESPFISIEIKHNYTSWYRFQGADIKMKKERVDANLPYIPPQEYHSYQRVIIHVYGQSGGGAFPNPSLFVTADYIKREGGKIVPVAPYEDYEVINYLK